MKWKRPHLWIGLAIGGCVLVSSLVWVAGTRHYKPEFYQKLLAVPVQTSEEQGRLLERNIANVRNQLRRGRPWSVQLGQDQVNGWLASDLPEKFPHLVQSIREPRCQFSNEGFQLAFQLHSSGTQAVVQVAGQVGVTDVPNQVAIRIDRVRAGVLPIPISWWADRLAESLASRDILLAWSESEAAPVALLTLPGSFAKTNRVNPSTGSKGKRAPATLIDVIGISAQGIGIAGHSADAALDSMLEPGDENAEIVDRHPSSPDCNRDSEQDTSDRLQ